MHAPRMANTKTTNWDQVRKSFPYDIYVECLKRGESLSKMHESHVARLEKYLEDKLSPYAYKLWRQHRIMLRIESDKYGEPNPWIRFTKDEILLAEDAFTCLAIDEQLGS